jgi:hypothetical protein
LISDSFDVVLGLAKEPPQARAFFLVHFKLLLGFLKLAHFHVAFQGFDGLVSIFQHGGEVSDRGLQPEGQQGLLGLLS